MAAMVVDAHRKTAAIEEFRHVAVAAGVLTQAVQQHDAAARLAHRQQVVGDVERRPVGRAERAPLGPAFDSAYWTPQTMSCWPSRAARSISSKG